MVDDMPVLDRSGRPVKTGDRIRVDVERLPGEHEVLRTAWGYCVIADPLHGEMVVLPQDAELADGR